jgi:hypothetical protein
VLTLQYGVQEGELRCSVNEHHPSKRKKPRRN